MSKIDKLIQELQLKKKKIDYIDYIVELLKGDTTCIDFKEVQSEVLSKVEPLLLSLKSSIENDLPQEIVEQRKSEFEPKELQILKTLASKAMDRVQNSSTPLIEANSPFIKEIPPAQPRPPKKPLMSNHDKINFAMSNRHLADKKVKFNSDEGIPITGKVVGLDAPNVVVKTDSGPTVEVPLERIQLS